MSPVGHKKERNLGGPPFFSISADRQSWRRKVASWAGHVYEAAQEREDKILKTILKTLVQTLYEIGLPQAQQSITECKIPNGVVKLK